MAADRQGTRGILEQTASAHQLRIESRGPVVLAVTISMTVLSFLFVLGRITSRTFLVRKITADDYVIVIAWIIAFGFAFDICFATSVGLGRHRQDIPKQWQSALQKSEYVFSVLYENPALMATKTSICVFYLSLAQTQKMFKWTTVGTLVVVNAAGLALTLLNTFQCRPVGAAYNISESGVAHCTDIMALYLSSAPVNIITDLALLFLPMPVLTKMRLPKKQKIILIITFSFGFFVAVVDVVRIAYLQEATLARLNHVQTGTGGARLSQDEDFSWYASLSFMWSAVEVHVGIMVACVPGLKPLASRLVPRMLHGSHDVSNHSAAEAAEKVRDVHRADVTHGSQRAGDAEVPEPQTETRCPGGPPVDMMEFLTTPDMPAATQKTAAPLSRLTSATRATPPSFNFVRTGSMSNMTQMNNRESLFPLAMVTFLFFLWGFAYGLLDVLNSQFQIIARMSSGQTTGIHSAYFGGYFIGPISIGQYVFRRWGFKACYTTGLIIYACGTLVFWPSAVLTSFPAFLISNFIVGVGLSTLEISANPFIALCGPADYAEIRLNLSQGVQAIGTIVSPLLAKKVLFKKANSAGSLVEVQWTYLGIALFTVLLALVYYYIPLPEATDEDFEAASDRYGAYAERRIFGVDILLVSLGLGTLAMFFYVGGQEVVSTSFIEYIHEVDSNLDSVGYQAIGHTLFAVSRFCAAALNRFVKPRHILAISYAGCIVFLSLCMSSHGAAATAFVVLVYFFMGPLFPTLFAQVLRGMGKRTKLASTFLTAAISGGAVFPPIAAALSHHGGTQYSLCVALATYCVSAVYVVYLYVVLVARSSINSSNVHTTRVGGQGHPVSELVRTFTHSLHLRKARTPTVQTQRLERRLEENG